MRKNVLILLVVAFVFGAGAFGLYRQGRFGADEPEVADVGIGQKGEVISISDSNLTIRYIGTIEVDGGTAQMPLERSFFLTQSTRFYAVAIEGGAQIEKPALWSDVSNGDTVAIFLWAGDELNPWKVQILR